MKNWSLNYVSIAMVIPYIVMALSDQIEGTAETAALAVGVIAGCIFLVRSVIGLKGHEDAAPLALMVSAYSIAAALWLGL